MVKPTIAAAGICSMLLCIQSTAAANTAAAVPQDTTSGKTESAYRTGIEKRYAEQDQELERAELLVKKDDLPKAIRIYQDVYFGLTLESEQIDSWKAKSRLNEIGKRLAELKLTLGSKKLNEATAAFDSGRYNDAITLAAEAATICPELNGKAADLRIMSQSKQRGEERIQAAAAERVFPEINDVEKKISVALAEAKVLMKNRKFEEARRRIESVYKLNPFNPEAAYLASQIYSQYYTAGYYRHRADVESLMANEAWQWVEPTFYRNEERENLGDSSVKGVSDREIQAKLDAIVIPSVKYDETNITSVVTHLTNSSKRYDKNGVIINYIPIRQLEAAAPVTTNQSSNENSDNLDEAAPAANTPGTQQQNQPAPQDAEASKEILVSLNVSNASLREILDYISFVTDLPYRVLPERIIIGDIGEKLESREFTITPEAVALITGDPQGQRQAEAETSAGGDKDSGSGDGMLASGEVLDIDISPEDLKKFFTTYGIDFSIPGSNIVYESGKINMTNTPANMRAMDDLLLLINTPQPMVQIELKSIEMSDTDMEELGFNWSLNVLSRRDKGHSWSTGQGENAMLGQALNVLGNSLSGEAFPLINNLNIFPDIFGSVNPFGADNQLNLSLTINALDRNTRTETISAPSVTVADRARATIKLGTIYYFPESWEELEIEMDGGDGDSGYNISTTPPMPEFSEGEEVGTNFTVTPQIKKNRIINLAIKPDVTAYIGNDNYEIPVNIERWNATDRRWEQDKDLSKVFTVWKPIITTRSLDLNVNVFDGETLVLGGLSDSVVTTRLDKIPILGDLPLIGRLFQSQSESSTRKTMLIFVTARLVNDAGLPVYPLDKTGGIPDVNR